VDFVPLEFGGAGSTGAPLICVFLSTGALDRERRIESAGVLDRKHWTESTGSKAPDRSVGALERWTERYRFEMQGLKGTD
jgi:hypothetical protein